MGLQSFYGKRPHRSLLAGSRTPRGQIAIGGSPNCLNYCVLFYYMHSSEMWPRAAKYKLADRGLGTSVQYEGPVALPLAENLLVPH
jgi:hypothetical protein